jgi:hypothetical protein
MLNGAVELVLVSGYAGSKSEAAPEESKFRILCSNSDFTPL